MSEDMKKKIIVSIIDGCFIVDIIKDDGEPVSVTLYDDDAREYLRDLSEMQPPEEGAEL